MAVWRLPWGLVFRAAVSTERLLTERARVPLSCSGRDATLTMTRMFGCGARRCEVCVLRPRAVLWWDPVSGLRGEECSGVESAHSRRSPRTQGDMSDVHRKIESCIYWRFARMSAITVSS